MPIPGLGEFTGGLLHPLCTPAHDLVLLSLGLLLAQEKPLRPGASMAAFAVLMLIGLVFSQSLPSAVLIALGLGISTLVILARPLPHWIRSAACAFGALAIGLDSASGLTGLAAAKMAGGVWTSTTLCVLNLAFYISLLPAAKWAATAVRIAGSWIAAIGILMLAFALIRTS